MSAKLIILDGNDKGRELRIAKDNFRIGRSNENDLILMDDLTSRVHAELKIDENGRYLLKDYKSKNGIFVNGIKVTEHFLKDSDIFQIGKNKILFKMDEIHPLGKIEIISKSSEKHLPKNAMNEGITPSEPPFVQYGQEIGEDEPTNIAPKNLSSQSFFVFENLKLKIKALHQAAKAVSNAQSDSSLLKAIMNIILQSMTLDRGGIFILDQKTKSFKPCLFHTRYGEKLTAEDIDFDIVAGEFKKRNFSFLSREEDLPIIKDKNISKDLCFMLSAIRSGEKINGFLYLDCLKENYTYTDDDLETLEALADQIALGLQKSNLLKNNKEMAGRLINLEKHLSPEIVNAISDKNKPLLENPFEAQEREVTVLFSDIEDFTTLSERLTPVEISSLLNEYFSRMVEIIISNKGTINKFIGDAIMAIFGAPIIHGNDTQNAVNSALQMIETLKSFYRQIDEKKRFNIRIGINTGNVVVGLIGSEKKMEYTVLGDTVNCASRIENLAPPNRIAIGEITYERVKDKFDCESIGQINLKGKSKSVNVYLVKGVK